MASKLFVSKLSDYLVGFVRLDQQPPHWASGIPLQRHDRLIGFVEDTSEGQPFVLAEEALFLREGETWTRIPYSEIAKIQGQKGNTFWETMITINLRCNKSLEYRGRNSFGLWNCLQRLIAATESRLEISLNPYHSSILKSLSKKLGKHRNDIVHEWISEKLKSQIESFSERS